MIDDVRERSWWDKVSPWILALVIVAAVGGYVYDSHQKAASSQAEQGLTEHLIQTGNRHHAQTAAQQSVLNEKNDAIIRILNEHTSTLAAVAALQSEVSGGDAILKGTAAYIGAVLAIVCPPGTTVNNQVCPSPPKE